MNELAKKEFWRSYFKLEVTLNIVVIPPIIYFVALCMPFVSEKFNIFLPILLIAVGVSMVGGLIPAKSLSSRVFGEKYDKSLAQYVFTYPFKTSVVIIIRWIIGSFIVWTPFLLWNDIENRVFFILMGFGINAGLASASFGYLFNESSIITIKKDLSITTKNTNQLNMPHFNLKRRIVTFSLLILTGVIANILLGYSLASEQGIELNKLTIGFILIIAESIVVSIIIGQALAANLQRSINDIKSFLKEIAENKGDLTKSISLLSLDEIGDMVEYFNLFVRNLREIVSGILDNVTQVSTASENVSEISNAISSNTKEMSTQSTTVASATEQSTANITHISEIAQSLSLSSNTVSSAVEEMSASLNEVSTNCARESKIATKANEMIKNTKNIMNRLTASTTDINMVVEIINDIAEQTNLLALNATIEAASAGDAGKGFAVVASEVKDLAKQTSTATGDIKTKVDEMQSSTGGVVKSINEITNIIEELNIISQSIVAAIEEQSATTNEISSNLTVTNNSTNEIAGSIQEAASGLSEISSNMQHMNVAVQDTSKGINNVKDNVKNLASIAESLRDSIGIFKV